MCIFFFFLFLLTQAERDVTPLLRGIMLLINAQNEIGGIPQQVKLSVNVLWGIKNNTNVSIFFKRLC